MIVIPAKAEGRHHPGEHLVLAGTEDPAGTTPVPKSPVAYHQEPGRLGTCPPAPMRPVFRQAAEAACLHGSSKFLQGRIGWLAGFHGLSPSGLRAGTLPAQGGRWGDRPGPVGEVSIEKRPQLSAGRIDIQAQGKMKTQQAAHFLCHQESGRRVRRPDLTTICSCFFC